MTKSNIAEYPPKLQYQIVETTVRTPAGASIPAPQLSWPTAADSGTAAQQPSDEHDEDERRYRIVFENQGCTMGELAKKMGTRGYQEHVLWIEGNVDSGTFVERVHGRRVEIFVG